MEETSLAWKLETSEKDRELAMLPQELAALKQEVIDKMAKKVADNCSKHPSKQRLLYCDDCGTAICSDCRHDHPFRLIEDVWADAVESLALASHKNQEMQHLLGLEKDHAKLINGLREEREKWFAEMRVKHESAIREGSAEIDKAFAQLRDHQARHEQRLDAIEWKMDSLMMNRVAEHNPMIKNLVSAADVILKDIRGIPFIANLQKGLPSISIDTRRVLLSRLENPWLASFAETLCVNLSASHADSSSGAGVVLSRAVKNDRKGAMVRGR